MYGDPFVRFLHCGEYSDILQEHTSTIFKVSMCEWISLLEVEKHILGTGKQFLVYYTQCLIVLVGCVILVEGLYVFILGTVATGYSDVGKSEPNKVVVILAQGLCNWGGITLAAGFCDGTSNRGWQKYNLSFQTKGLPADYFK